MSDAKNNNGRNSDGTFGKGNKCSKLDFTREQAKHVTSQELYWAARMLTQIPMKELKEIKERGELENESLFTYMLLSKATKGDFRPVQFLVEMILGKPKQQVDLGDNRQPICLEFVNAKNRTS